MLNPTIKRLAFSSILLYIFLLHSHYTDADLFADRTVAQNSFRAITLDFLVKTSFNNNAASSLFHSLGFQAGGFDVAALRMQRATQSSFLYHMKTVKTNGDDALCGALNLQVLSRTFGPIYTGRLMDLSFKKRARQTPMPAGAISCPRYCTRKYMFR